MLSIETARKLRAAGLPWAPALHDFFAIPEHGLEDRLFVISDLPVNIAELQGQSVFTFEGAVEWALDYIVTTDAVWLPTEAQLRRMVESRMPEEAGILLNLTCLAEGYRVTIQPAGQPLHFSATSAEEAYAAALLHLLNAD
jgi:hypothetical protein